MKEVGVIVSDEVMEIFPLDTGRIQKFAACVFKSNGVSECDVSIVFIGDAKMTSMNEMYKGHKGSTDVLSFNLTDEGSDKLEGEVYVSLERAKEQSLEYNVPYKEEVIRLVTHGILHLTGRVHTGEEEYKKMVEDTEKTVKNFFTNGDLL